MRSRASRSVVFRWTLATLAAAALPLLPAPTSHAAPPETAHGQQHQAFGVYVRLVEGVRDRSFDDVLLAVRRGIQATEWTVLADYESAVDRSKCAFRARVFVVHSPAYARAVLAHGTVAAFALPLRLAVYQDENGIHVSATNPQSLNRTIVAETGFETASADAVAALRRMVASQFAGSLADRQHGQLRTRGLIGRTMGILAGGPFADQIETAVSVRAEGADALTAAADRVFRGLERTAGRRRWQTRPVYRLNLAEQGVVVIGVTGAAMEARAFDIVHHGNDQTRQNLACPGIDHAAAFPIEIVLTREGDQVRALMVDEMFRMKVYFEDAGRTKFAMNMRMPGSIENEIRDLLEESLGT